MWRVSLIADVLASRSFANTNIDKSGISGYDASYILTVNLS
jgi:hypothetical protein